MRCYWPRRLTILLFGALSLVNGETIFAWGVGHDDASRLGAMASPEPFKSNAALCVYAHYPDSMQDHAVGHGRDGYVRRLFTFEAIDALRAGDVPKAMFLASAATHYLTDRACIAHATRAWYHKSPAEDPWAKYLPKKYQDVFVPHGSREVYYPHLKASTPDMCLFLPEPEYCVDIWRKYRGSLNAYFDSLPSVRRYVSPEMLRTPAQWTFTDFDEYARWYADFISLDMLDPASLNGPELRFRDAAGMKAVCVEELLNGVAQCAAYFGYLCTAAKTEMMPSLQAVLPEFDKLMAFARTEPLVLISKDAPWPVERAAHVLAIELLRAERRRAKSLCKPEPTQKVADYVLRASPQDATAALRNRNAIALLGPEDQELAYLLNAPPIPPGQNGIISACPAQRTGPGIIVHLHGATRQDTLYLVDYFLDLAWAPIHGRWPAERVVEVLKQVWAGWRLILDLREMKGDEAVAYARKLPYNHLTTRERDTAKYEEALRKGVQAGASEEEWRRHFLLEIALPDGRRASDMIEKGTGYSDFIPLVNQ